jgi:acetate kinase
MSDSILTLNAGSSSIKFALFETSADRLEVRFRGQVEGIRTSPRFVVSDGAGQVMARRVWEDAGPGADHTGAIEHIWEWLQDQYDSETIVATGHRMTHGGNLHTRPVLIDAEVMAALESLVPLVPLHQPHNLAAVRALARSRPEMPQVACFDTAFHARRPSVSQRFALPSPLYDEGIRRYGFHGLSYAYIARRMAELAPEVAGGRMVVAHLGSGCSMCAMEAGASVETTMGFSALDGLPMGTRCGSLDPGVLIYLLRERGMDIGALEELLYKRSGLLGISGVSSDLRDLLASEEALAREAIDCFVYRIGQSLGALAAALGGLDALVFTAGIGENAPLIRERVCRDAAWLGIELDPAANTDGGPRISVPGASPSAWVIPTDEERMIALDTHELVQGRA